MHIFWDITRECNLKCVHCYNAPERARMTNDISLEKNGYLIKELSKKYKGSTLHFLGGEPMAIDDFENITVIASNFGFKLELTTNGTIFNEERILFLQKYYEVVHVSLDGVEQDINDKIRGKGVFLKVNEFLEKWKLLADHNTKCADLDLSFTVTKSTLSCSDELINFCLMHDIKSLTVQPIKLLGNADKSEKKFGITAEEYFEFGEKIARSSLGEPIKLNITGGSLRYKEYIKWKYYNDIVNVEPACDAGTGQIRINSLGQIQPCIMGSKITESITNTDYIKNRDSFNDSFKNKVILLKSANANKQPDICAGCEYFSAKKCYGGCAIQGSFGPAQLCTVLKNKN